MMMTNPHDNEMDDLFARARDLDTAPSDDLMARVLADAAAVQAGFVAVSTQPMPTLGLWGQLREALGGWPSLGGLAAATVAGVWIGVAPPASVADVTAGFWGEAITVPMVPGDLGFDTGDFADG